MMCGGAAAAVDASDKTQELCDKVRSDLEAKCGRQFPEFKAISVSTQVVAGTNHFVKVHVGNEEYVHVRIFEPLPHTKEPPSLHSHQLGKSKDDEVGFF